MFDNFGFIHNKLEIKLLILYILRRLPEPISFDKLAELTMCDEGISYFDFTQCVADLVSNENLILADGMYSLTKKGAKNSDITEGNLPYSVRVRVEESTYALRTAMNRSAMIKTSSTPHPECGYIVKLALADGVGEIVSMELFAANEKQATALENGFRKNAESIYNKLIDTILE